MSVCELLAEEDVHLGESSHVSKTHAVVVAFLAKKPLRYRDDRNDRLVVAVALQSRVFVDDALDVLALDVVSQLTEVPDVADQRFRDGIDSVGQDGLGVGVFQSCVGASGSDSIRIAGSYEYDVLRESLCNELAVERAPALKHDLGDEALQRTGVELIEEHPDSLACSGSLCQFECIE